MGCDTKKENQILNKKESDMQYFDKEYLTKC